jgi:toxin CcdB
MAKYDLFRNPDGAGYLLDVQTDLLAGLNTRIVVPLLPAALAPVPARRLNPVVELDEGPHVMVTQFLSAVPAALLKAPVGTLGTRFAEVTAAIDLLLQGF